MGGKDGYDGLRKHYRKHKMKLIGTDQLRLKGEIKIFTKHNIIRTKTQSC